MLIPRDIHIECSEQFKWNLYFYVSGQSGPWFKPLFNILLHTHSNVCATVWGQCLEYLVYIALGEAWVELGKPNNNYIYCFGVSCYMYSMYIKSQNPIDIEVSVWALCYEVW